MKKSTIREVARLANVSPATVSRAINGTGIVTEDTKQRIAEAIRISGYQLPAEADKSVVSPAAFIYFVMKSPSVNVYSRLLNHHLIVEAEKRGMTVVTAGLETSLIFPEAEMQFHLEQANRIGAKGIVISGFTDKTMDERAVQALSRSPLPVVSISRSLFNSNYNFNHILTGSDRGGFQATHHLIENGRRHLLMVSLPHHVGKVLGFESAVSSSSAEGLCSQIRIAPDDSFESCANVLEEALKEDPKIDGILCCADELAAHILQALTRMGKSVPDQVELIGYNDNLAPLLNPPISSVRVPLAEIAECTIDLLVDKKRSAHGSTHKSILLDPQLILR